MTSKIVSNIDRRLGELYGEIAKLNAARAALLSRATPPVATKPRRRRPTAPPPTARQVPAAKLTTLLASTDGMTTRQLADITQGAQSQILSRLRQLEQGDQVRRSGQRRGTRWHLVTDEDRIAARVA